MNAHNDTPSLIAEHSLALVHYSLSRQGDRDYNEDAYCHVRDGDLIAFAVADGMGGKSGGAQAAALAMEHTRNARLTLDSEQFSKHFVEISNAIKARQSLTPELSDMCTTLAELRIDT